jgi:MtrB/PioB family decaheme-associated outer membrane protein
MKTREERFAVSAISLAVQGALIAMCAAPVAALAQGENDDLNALIYPTNYIEVGAMNVSRDSAKFGEYNGLNKKDGYLRGNFGIRGGDAYGEGSSGTMRWDVNGTDIGTDSRSLGGSVSDQGTWSLGISYDQLRHNITDTYQTPFQGSMGGNNFTLPSNFGVINTATTTTNGVLTSPSKGSQNFGNYNPAALGDFHNEDVYSERKNTSFNAGYIFNRQWDVKFDYNHLEQSGAKLIGAPSDKAVVGPLTYGGETIAILMNPTSYKTDTFNLALNWGGEKGYATVSYYASMFHDDYRGVSWQSPFETGAATGNSPGAAGFPTSTMSTPPSNQFHQLNLTGGYSFNSTTKLAGGLSYGRNTQDEGYGGTYTPGRVLGLSPGSLDGRVITKHADLKLTSQVSKDLLLSGGVKYNERDNQTSSNMYQFYDLGTTTGATPATVFNIPMSNKRTQVEIAGDYRIDKRQNLHLAYEYDQIKRWCDSGPSLAQIDAATKGLGGSVPLANAYYGSGSDCAQVPKNTENKLVVGYRLRPNDAVNFNVGYSYGKRTADVNPAFYNPMQGNSEGFELPGYVAFFDASRREHLLKIGANWQATERLNLGVNGRYTKDLYDGSIGAQDGHAASVNLDGTYTLSENSTVSVYATWQERRREFTNDQWGSGVTGSSHSSTTYYTSDANPWTNTLTDRDTTVGISGKQKGLVGGKLALMEDLTYSKGQSSYSTSPGFTILSGAAPGTPNLINCGPNGNISCGSLPDINSEMIQFKLTGSYQVSKPGKIVAGYTYQRLKSDDYFYNAYQYGYTPTSLLPTNQQAPSYSVNAVFVAYDYEFK